MSALPPNADINEVVGNGKYARWNREPDCLSSQQNSSSLLKIPGVCSKRRGSSDRVREKALFRYSRQCLFTILSLGDFVTCPGKHIADNLATIRLILHDKNVKQAPARAVHYLSFKC
jgi:hypothetical protein